MLVFNKRVLLNFLGAIWVFGALLFSSNICIAQEPSYKQMIYDPQYNIYQVRDSAEAYFATIDREIKGSGWKPFMRWFHENEPKFYPSGDRSQVDLYLPEKSFEAFIKNNPKVLFPSGWNDLGPYTIDTISSHYAAGLGRIEDVYVHPSNSNIVYLASRSGGFWGTQDGGVTWYGGTTDFLPASGANTVTANPANPNEILINCRNAQNGTSHGVYRSLDGGLTWAATNFVPGNVGFGGLGSNFQIYEVKFHPSVANLIFVGTSQGMYRSANNLTSWTQHFNGGDIAEIHFHPANPNYVYVYNFYTPHAQTNQISYSTNLGLTYTLSSVIAGNNGNTNVILATSDDCPNCLYFSSSNGIWRSSDNGQNFTFLSAPAVGNGGFAVSDIDSSFMLNGYLDCSTSTNGGLNFAQRTWWSLGNTNGAGSGHYNSLLTSTNYIHADINHADYVDGSFYTCTDGFLCKSTDNGVSWVQLADSMGVRENYCVATSQSNHYRSICGSQDNGTSIAKETGWVEAYGADGMDGLIHPLNDNWMINSVQYGGRIRTLDGGTTVTVINPSGANSGDWIAPLELDPNNQMSFYEMRDVIRKTNDFGNTYSIIGSPSSFTGTIEEAAIAYNNSNILVISRGSAIDKSIDGGVTFASIKNNLPNFDINAVAIDPNDDNVMIVVYGNYQANGQKVFITTNGGASWSNITFNLSNMPVRTVVIDHTAQSNIYLGAEIGVYTMPMNGNNWTLYNPGLPNTSVRDLEICWGSNTLKAATWGRGLWEFNLVGRSNYPAILKTTISHQPTLTMPNQGVNQFVKSTISYDFTITKSWVEWSTNTAAFGNVINMTNTSGNNWISNAPLPDQPEGTNVFFRVLSLGQFGDTSVTHKFMYTVRSPLALNVCVSVNNTNDDVEQNTLTGALNFTSSDLEMCDDANVNQVIGIRFNNLAIPKDAIISNAYIEFTSIESDNSALNINIAGHASDNSGTWNGSFDVSNRPKTTATVLWQHTAATAWTVAGVYQSPSLTPIVQELVNRPGWDLNRSMSFILWGTSTNERVAYSRNGSSTLQPDLCIEFSLPVITPLSIELIDFSAQLDGRQVNLTWATASETDNDYFVIERSHDASVWFGIGEMDGAGNSAEILNYAMIDPSPLAGISYYRLKQIDFNGTAGYSELRPIVNSNFESSVLIPNPANDQVIVQSSCKIDNIELKNLLGQNCYVETSRLSDNSLILDVTNLSAGIYNVSIRRNNTTEVLKLMVK